MTRQSSLALLAPAIVLLVAFLVAPMLYLLSFSFAAAGDEPGIVSGLTLDNFAKLFSDRFYGGVFLKTLQLSALATVVATIVGFILAHLIWRAGSRWRGILTIVALAPLLVSIVATSYGWVVILGKDGVVNQILLALHIVSEPAKIIFTDTALVLGLVHVGAPFATLSILAILDRIDRSLPEAASTLGASPARTLFHVTIPLAMPGIAAGCTLVLSLSLSSYVTPAVLGGSGPNFVTTLIYLNFVTLLDWPFGATLASALLAMCFAVVLVSTWALARLAFAPRAT